jgi:RNA polymerase sigma factor (sigma-70 family)
MTTPPVTTRVSRAAGLPGYISHPDFTSPEAMKVFGPKAVLSQPEDTAAKYMPDEVTRDHAMRMHYALYRTHAARTGAERAQWHAAYLKLRDRIVLGNRKLVYRAVRRSAAQNRADDTIGECFIVLIQAVIAFNPWINVRFSTYAYTCLVRAMSRSARRHASDWLSRSLSFDVLADGEPGDAGGEPAAPAGTVRIDEFLSDAHPLLSDREKAIIIRRFSLAEGSGGSTLEQVGAAVGLSKERVRQVQATALEKLRAALGAGR